MKNIIFLAFAFLVFSFSNAQKKVVNHDSVNYTSYGDAITADNYLAKEEMYTKFKSLKKGDTINVKFASTINKVCKKKGCWMRLDLGKGENTMVRFKNYGFFMPLDSENKEVIVSGKAYIDVISVKQLQHYAEDEGLSKEDIDKITEDKITFAIESTGVLIKEM
ncbi:MAG TPA: DUF4920 domain-containing protein [Flavobacteriaceae bacterium]|nr:DUF4920 domain-containing protein [Flavobacteriaceae bacterium]HBS12935.1 DUF4920 domain-containing protein [Flavobacteriaceae bacterium]